MKFPSPITRRPSRQIMIGNLPIGGDAPIAVQSMTNTDTCDVDATVARIEALQEAGADRVRVSVPSMDAAEAFGRIRDRIELPLISDIHFDHEITNEELLDDLESLIRQQASQRQAQLEQPEPVTIVHS